MALINHKSIKLLREKFKDDVDLTTLFRDSLMSYEQYHSAIYSMEIHKAIYGYDNMDKQAFQDETTSLDKSRSGAHNAVIANLRILNRLAEQNGIPLIYEGIISEERPHRVEIADAVLAYVEELVKRRIK